MGKDVREKHENLYDRIPKMECKEGCSDCCGPVPFSKFEHSEIKSKKRRKTLNCPYSVEGKCEIYEVRPLMCRLFGAVQNKVLECPHGCRPVGLMNDEEARQLLAEYHKIMNE